jgi:hypothetical protein
MRRTNGHLKTNNDRTCCHGSDLNFIPNAAQQRCNIVSERLLKRCQSSRVVATQNRRILAKSYFGLDCDVERV